MTTQPAPAAMPIERAARAATFDVPAGIPAGDGSRTPRAGGAVPTTPGISAGVDRLDEALGRLTATIDGELEAAIGHIDTAVAPFLRPDEPQVSEPPAPPRGPRAGDETSNLGKYLDELAANLERRDDALLDASARIHRLAGRVDR